MSNLPFDVETLTLCINPETIQSVQQDFLEQSASIIELCNPKFKELDELLKSNKPNHGIRSFAIQSHLQYKISVLHNCVSILKFQYLQLEKSTHINSELEHFFKYFTQFHNTYITADSDEMLLIAVSKFQKLHDYISTCNF